MIKSIFNKIFNVREGAVVQRPKSFTQTDLGKPVAPKPKQLPAEETSTILSVDLAALFYSLLFSVRAKDVGGVANNLERRVIREVESALTSPDVIAETVLKLPSKVLELDKKLADPAFDIKELLALIERDPVLSVEVLKLCNSPAFKRGDRDVTSLQQALIQLGREQLRRFVTSCLVREMLDIKPIYFRRFGAEIWRHSMQVAYLASELSEEDSDTAFLLGLLHDVGKLAIFKMLLDAFVQAEPGEQPNSWLFRQVMTSKSLTLSALLAKHWQLPKAFEIELDRLANVTQRPMDGLAPVVWQANIISEISMLLQAERLSPELLNKLLEQVMLDRDEFEQLHQKLQQF
ncbi:HDOD domain-containing protein [Shewanella acanthi]|uniref:HDOD domain-containing protein n=1 Tax=Shewanella acanthi TaxID=2864212 RepID=UPI001C65EF77|nr:HDOD domain-containing protein [Shewanella acanthi]QYJ78891.1 HDOD domain-containing protein [Shewanella acanthi]